MDNHLVGFGDYAECQQCGFTCAKKTLYLRQDVMYTNPWGELLHYCPEDRSQYPRVLRDYDIRTHRATEIRGIIRELSNELASLEAGE